MKTREQMNAYQRDLRRRTNNQATKRYEKTPKGFLMRMYRNMQSRIEGVQWMKKHLYEGKELLSREDFYNWAEGSEKFLELYYQYKFSDYDRKLAPSVDRIDSSRGYTLDNMEWVTHSENSRRGSISKRKNDRKEIQSHIRSMD